MDIQYEAKSLSFSFLFSAKFCSVSSFVFNKTKLKIFASSFHLNQRPPFNRLR